MHDIEFSQTTKELDGGLPINFFVCIANSISTQRHSEKQGRIPSDVPEDNSWNMG